MFFYHIDIPKHHKLFSRKDKIVLWGSCFADELKSALYEDLFDVSGSPYGIMYNPISMAMGMNRLLENKAPRNDELFCHLGEWHSYMHHGRFSNADKDIAYKYMVNSFREAQEALHKASLLVLTFGTAYVYEQIKTGEVVNNCHKLPTKDYFTRRRIEVTEIVNVWGPIIRKLRSLNPQLEIIFTVSPICHYRDGAHSNRLSKAILHLAIDELCEEEGTYYFPSYEMMQDELREYRFYMEDFTHPNEQAVNYILDRFSNIYIDRESEMLLTKEWRSILGMLRHRPLTSHIPTIRTHYQRAAEKLIDFRKKLSHPFLDEQLDIINTKLQDISSYE